MCFQELRDGEFLKGREYQTLVRASAGGAWLQETDHAFSVTFYEYGYTPLAGLWHAFTAETQTDVKTYEGSGTPLDKKTKYTYDPAYTSIYNPATGLYDAGTAQYGNLSMIEEDTQDGVTPLRVTERRSTGRIDGATYMVDRQYSESVRDGLPPNGILRAMSQTFFDGNNTSPMTLGTSGQVTRVAKYYDVPLAANAQNITLHGQDTTFTIGTGAGELV